MRIIGVSRTVSTLDQVALVTDPPLTQEVFDEVVRQNSALVNDHGVSVHMSCLMIEVDMFASVSKDELTRILEKAANAVEKAKEAAGGQHEARLKRFSEVAGLPLVD